MHPADKRISEKLIDKKCSLHKKNQNCPNEKYVVIYGITLTKSIRIYSYILLIIRLNDIINLLMEQKDIP